MSYTPNNTDPYYNNVLDQYSDEESEINTQTYKNRPVPKLTAEAIYKNFTTVKASAQSPSQTEQPERPKSQILQRPPIPQPMVSTPSAELGSNGRTTVRPGMVSESSFETDSMSFEPSIRASPTTAQKTFQSPLPDIPVPKRVPAPAITFNQAGSPSRNNTLNVIPNATTFNQPNPDFNDNFSYKSYSQDSFINANAATDHSPYVDDFVNTNNLVNHEESFISHNDPVPSNINFNNNNSNMNLLSAHGVQNPSSIGSYSNDYDNYIRNDDPVHAFSPFRDSESGLDGPIYLDNQGDDYPINSYIRRNRTMVDPYKDNRDFHEVWTRHDDQFPTGQQQQQSTNFYDNNDFQEPSDYSNPNDHMDLGDGGNSDMEKMEFPQDAKNEETYSSHLEDDESSSLMSRNHPDQEKNTEVRKFLLENGNFVFDCPLSESLISSYYKSVDNPANVSNEFKFMRYQAATCEPDDYYQENFTLRQQKFMVPRRTELMIVITMYNEDEILLGRTLKGVFDNIKHMLKKSHSQTWGIDAWKKIVVCIVSDGRSKIHPRTLALMSALGCYQDGFAKSEISGKKVTAHIYEHTTKVNISKVTNDTIELNCDQTTVPVQLLFCLKENNQKKINSHRWAINAFAECLQPNVIVLLDAGTKPGKDSIYELWKEFKDPQVGGACGEIRVDLGNNFKNLVNPLVAAQNFEYKMSNILDKTTESNFGFITVLPGAFSAYRFEALKGKPLQKYFFGDNMDSIKLFASNMYLAEDRILCFEIITKHNANWILKYCKNSYGSTDVPEHIPEFMLQRRRWMNGSFFASLYSFIHMFQIWSSGQSIIRKFFLTIESIYLLINTVVAWFSLSSFFLVFRILTLSISVNYHKIKAFNYLSVIFLWLYGFTILTTFILSLGNKPKGTKYFYLCVFIFFAILMAYVIFCSVYLTIGTIKTLVEEKGTVTFKKLILSAPFRDLLVSMGSTYALYIYSSVICLQPWHMITCFIQYLLLSPAYINVLNIYAFCNVHDITWGTKGASKASPLGKIAANKDGSVQAEIPVSAVEIEKNFQVHSKLLATKSEGEDEQVVSFDEQKQSYYASVRSLILLAWIISNFAIAAVVLESGGIQQYERVKLTGTNQATATVSVIGKRANIYFSIILWIVAILAAVRAIGCTVYVIKRCVQKFTRR